MSIQILGEEFTPGKSRLLTGLGRSIGQGFQEQFPKSFQSGQQAQAIEQFGQGDMDPLQRISGLIRSGMTPEQAQQLAPLLRSAILRKQAQQQTDQSQLTRPADALPQNVEQPSVGGYMEQRPATAPNAILQNRGQPNEKGTTVVPGRVNQNPTPSWLSGYAINQSALTSPESVQAVLDTPVNPTLQERQAESIRKMNENPERYLTLEEAEQATDKEVQILQQRRENLAQKRQNEIATTNAYENALNQRLQKNFQVKDVDQILDQIPGELYNELRDQGIGDIRAGMTPEQAAAKQAELGNDLRKSISKIRNDLGIRGFAEKPTPTMKQDIGRERKNFEKLGERGLEIFQKELKNSMKLTDHSSTNLTFPPSKQLSKTLETIRAEDDYVSIADKVRRSIQPEDSIFTLGNELYNAGIDDREIIDFLKRFEETGALELSRRQREELSDYYPAQASLGDIFFNMVGNIGTMIQGGTGKISTKKLIESYAGANR